MTGVRIDERPLVGLALAGLACRSRPVRDERLLYSSWANVEAEIARGDVDAFRHHLTRDAERFARCGRLAWRVDERPLRRVNRFADRTGTVTSESRSLVAQIDQWRP